MQKLKKIALIFFLLIVLIYTVSRVGQAVNYSGYRQTYQRQHWEQVLNNFITAVQNDITAVQTSITSLTTSISNLSALVTNWIITEDYPVMETAAITYSDGDTFTVAGDKTAKYLASKKIEAYCGADGMKYSTVASSSYGGGVTTVNLTDSVLTSNLSWVRITVTRAGLWPKSPGYVVAEDYGSPGQATFEAARDVISNSRRTLVLGPGPWSFSTASSTPATLNLRLEAGAVLTRAGGDHLTIGGGFEAPETLCISDNSTNHDWVIFESVSTAKTVWWGLTATDSANNHAYTRSAINALCGNTNKTGGLVLFPGGRLQFATAIIPDAHPGNNLFFKGGGAVHATVAGTTTPDAGTILEYSGSDRLFGYYCPEGTSNEGNVHWEDLAIVCTSTGSGISLNDISLDMGEGHPCFVVGWSLKNVQIFGAGGAVGLAGMGAFRGHLDNNCYIQGFERGIWLIDADGNECAATLGLNAQNWRVESKTATFGNSNRFIGMMNPPATVGAVPIYAIYDTGHSSFYSSKQIEVTTGQKLFYLNGSDIIFEGSYLGSNSGVSDGGDIGANAKNIHFNSPTGNVTTWNIDPPYTYFPMISYGGDFSVYIKAPSTQFAATVPAINPRIVPIDWPIPDGGPGTVAGSPTAMAAADAVNAFLGLHGPRSQHLRIDAKRKGWRAGGNTGVEWALDADATDGYALTLAKYTATQLLERQLTVGTHVATTDTLVISTRYKASGTPTGGICSLQVYNATTAAYIANVAMTAGTTSYQVWSRPVALSGSVTKGDDLRIRLYHTWTDGGGDLSMSVDYLVIVPVAEKIHTRLMDFEATADPGNTAADHGAVYWRKVAGKMNFFARAPSGGEILIAAEP